MASTPADSAHPLPDTTGTASSALSGAALSWPRSLYANRPRYPAFSQEAQIEWAARLASHVWREDPASRPLPHIFTCAVLDAVLERNDRHRPVPLNTEGLSAEEIAGRPEVCERDFCEWLELCDELICDVYGIAAASLPHDTVPPLPDVRRFCLAALFHHWKLFRDSAWGAPWELACFGAPVDRAVIAPLDPALAEHQATVRAIIAAHRKPGWEEAQQRLRELLTTRDLESESEEEGSDSDGSGDDSDEGDSGESVREPRGMLGEDWKRMMRERETGDPQILALLERLGLQG